MTNETVKAKDDDEDDADKGCFDDWMYKTFDNSKGFSKVLKNS
jgi:hypothetical protein